MRSNLKWQRQIIKQYAFDELRILLHIRNISNCYKKYWFVKVVQNKYTHTQQSNWISKKLSTTNTIISALNYVILNSVLSKTTLAITVFVDIPIGALRYDNFIYVPLSMYQRWSIWTNVPLKVEFSILTIDKATIHIVFLCRKW